MINGERIYLRLPELSDLDSLHKLRNQEENWFFVKQYRPVSREESVEWIKKATEKAQKMTDYKFVIVNKEINEVIGVANVNQVDFISRTTKLSIILMKEFQNNGYGTEAIKLLLDFSFNTLNLELVIIDVMSNNPRGIKVYGEKVKFKKDGTLRRRGFENNEYWDKIYLSMTKEEYMEGIKDGKNN
jgi:diamine N-acetyltransferase